jgi:hypothetical protein
MQGTWSHLGEFQIETIANYVAMINIFIELWNEKENSFPNFVEINEIHFAENWFLIKTEM